jgi:hypothetical protein
MLVLGTDVHGRRENTRKHADDPNEGDCNSSQRVSERATCSPQKQIRGIVTRGSHTGYAATNIGSLAFPSFTGSKVQTATCPNPLPRAVPTMEESLPLW